MQEVGTTKDPNGFSDPYCLIGSPSLTIQGEYQHVTQCTIKYELPPFPSLPLPSPSFHLHVLTFFANLILTDTLLAAVSNMEEGSIHQVCSPLCYFDDSNRTLQRGSDEVRHVRVEGGDEDFGKDDDFVYVNLLIIHLSALLRLLSSSSSILLLLFALLLLMHCLGDI